MDNQKNVLFYSYEEYTQNYEKEFQSFLEKHPNAREEDFLDNIEYYYKSWFYNEQGGFIEGIIVDKKNHSGYDKSIMQFDDFAYTVDSYLMLYVPFFFHLFRVDLVTPRYSHISFSVRNSFG